MTSAKVLPAAIGIALGLAITVLTMWLAPVGKPPHVARSPVGGAPLAEVEGPLQEVLFHYVPRLEPLLQAPYGDFLGTLEPDTQLVAVVPRQPGVRARLRAFLAGIDETESLWRRTRVVAVQGPISPWSKDRALVLGPTASDERGLLLMPTQPSAEWRERFNDWQTVKAVADAFPKRYLARELPLEMDAGDFAVAAERVLVDVNLIAKNNDRGIHTPAQLKRALQTHLDRDVLVLGERPGDVPRHHMSMYMTPLGARDGRPVALVGDPRLARELIGEDFEPGEHSPDSGEPLRADFSTVMQGRHDRAARELERAGFEVVRIPTVAFDDKTYMAYTNGVFASDDGARIAWVPRFGIDELDARAHAVYRKLGWQVRPVQVRGVYQYHGTIGCLVNVLSRSPARALATR